MLKQIKYFQTVVRCKSFTEAAEECYISQSAISQQIRALENELGVKLLKREKRSFSLTKAGEYFYKKSLVLTADFERLCNETARIANDGEKRLRIGYLKRYGGQELQHAVAEFSAKYPDAPIDIVNGNHEELYDLLRFGDVDLVLNDQRRAFSDEYVNLPLMICNCYIEISNRSPVSRLESVNVEDLKNTPCILVASRNQQENELVYYRDVVGFSGEFLFAENLDEARLMAAGMKGFVPVEGAEQTVRFGTALCGILLCRNNRPVRRNYCAFWKTDNANPYVVEFADILKLQFQDKL